MGSGSSGSRRRGVHVSRRARRAWHQRWRWQPARSQILWIGLSGCAMARRHGCRRAARPRECDGISDIIRACHARCLHTSVRLR